MKHSHKSLKSLICISVLAALFAIPHAMAQSSNSKTQGALQSTSEVAPGTDTPASQPEDFGPFRNSSEDAVSFHTNDFADLQMERALFHAQEGEYRLPQPVGPAEKEMVQVQTEAEFCYSCVLSGIQIPPLNMGGNNGDKPKVNNNRGLFGGIPLNTATGARNLPPDQSMKIAIKQMCDYVKKNPSCSPNRHAIVSDASRGSGDIRTSIIDVSTCGTSGDAKIVDGPFPTGGGSGGIGNVSGSHATPPGFFKMGDMGLNTRKKWPTCSNGVNFNYFLMHGQGCKYGLPGESCGNTNARKREVLYHTWPQIGASTWGCTGVPTDRFCAWGDKLKGSCIYNYVGS